ncbi:MULTISPECIES: hypothetical protein [Sphingomonas]|uniref:hypothetical protein n=1 Tax=Sphingomonas TaxID=13687 RepID=UPI00082D34CE|nr:hypothetical protein [Sphingomonas sp. CCH10-B3]
MRFFVLLLALVGLADNALATSESPLIGVWSEIDGTGAARIAPCAGNPDRLCAIGLARRSDGRAGRVDTGVVLSDITTSGNNRWRGTYHDGKRQLPATLQLATPRIVEMKVCLFLFCKTARYARDR